MNTISVRIDDKLKKKMKKFKYVNWSEILRAEIIRVVERLEKRDLARALLINERVLKRGKGDTTKIIKEWRKRRYGRSGC